MIGWAPAPTQPKPLPRGSAQKSLKDLPEELARLEAEQGDIGGVQQPPTADWDSQDQDNQQLQQQETPEAQSKQ